MTLPDDDFARIEFDCLGSQVGGKAVFFSTQKDNADDSGEMNPAQWDVRYGEHQRTIRKTALRPCIFAWKGITPVAFDISDGILKPIGRFVNENRPIYRMPHTVNAVPALHEGHPSKRPHDVVFDRREGTKPNRATCMEFWCLNIQHDAFLSKSIPGNANLIVLFLKNRVGEWQMEGLRMEYRNAIDVMTTETTCWSSIWVTDEKTRQYFTIHGRPEAYKQIKPADVAYYDGCVYVDLSTVECTIAMPMHPSNTYTIHELQENAADILHLIQTQANKQIKGANMDIVSKLRDGAIWVEQGEIAGCAGGTFDNICAAADILRGRSCGNGAFSLSIYPGSMTALAELMRNGCAHDLISAGAILRECFCGPCFGAGDTPANGEFSIRHTTRNYPNREGSKPGEGQMSAVALMDARSIAATAANGGKLTAATDLDVEYRSPEYRFAGEIYEKRVYNGWTKPEPEHELKFGPNIKDWPEMPALTDDLLVKVCSYITDPVTTTDELIPSGETSSYRSNPERLSEFALSRRDPQYVSRSKVMRQMERDRRAGKGLTEEVKAVYAALTAAGVKNDPEKSI